MFPYAIFRTKECGLDGSDVTAGQGTAWDAQGQAGVALTSSNEEEAREPFSTGCPLSVVPGPRSRHLWPADRDMPVRVVTAAMIAQSSELREHSLVRSTNSRYSSLLNICLYSCVSGRPCLPRSRRTPSTTSAFCISRTSWSLTVRSPVPLRPVDRH